MGAVLLALHSDLVHVDDDGVRSVEYVLVSDGAVFCKLGIAESILMDDLHLFHNGGVAVFGAAWGEGVSWVDTKGGVARYWPMCSAN